jgi:hypothetical protein
MMTFRGAATIVAKGPSQGPNSQDLNRKLVMHSDIHESWCVKWWSVGCTHVTSHEMVVTQSCEGFD